MFRTELNIPPSEWKITWKSKIFSVGSCFAIHIGQLLEKNKFQTLTNPFGTIFNPLSLFHLIHLSLGKGEIENWTFIKNQGVYRNYLFHSDVSATDQNHLQSRIRESLNCTEEFLRDADVVLLTFGTSIVYRLASNKKLVANCHKVPSRHFERPFLTSAQIVDSFQSIYDSLKEINKNIKFILTVSPVRHFKEGLVQNSMSKAILRVAAGQLSDRYEDVDYFPSFELLIDDLRDYRFYSEDMLHPNDQAVKYVWQKFVSTYMDDATAKQMADWNEVLKAMNHRPFNPSSEEHKNFLRKTLEKVEKFKNVIDISKEVQFLKDQLND